MHGDNVSDFSPWAWQEASMPFVYGRTDKVEEAPSHMTNGKVVVNGETLTINDYGEVVDPYGNFLFYSPFEDDKEWEKTIINKYTEYMENCE